MADYIEEQNSAYEDIAEAGGKIWFIREAKMLPKDPDKPWEGSDEEAPVEVEHVALFIPLKDSLAGVESNPFAESCLIPAKLLTFEVVEGTIFRKENGEILAVVNVIKLAPNGTQPILYTCEVNTWPGT